MRYTVSIFKKHLLMYTLMTVVCLSGCVAIGVFLSITILNELVG